MRVDQCSREARREPPTSANGRGVSGHVVGHPGHLSSIATSVELEVTIGADGKVVDARVVTAVGGALDVDGARRVTSPIVSPGMTISSTWTTLSRPAGTATLPPCSAFRPTSMRPTSGRRASARITSRWATS